ncbi:anhydro-N-acetylmuramic acid kinase [Limnoglobus roseus]|uniref:Anhydro-N-acetylmuramic acid kinase n=1 Tax=Limnoglobus roseus TaxID=2598579 RepID=A0A5C1AWA9_9BACT|nr:anhydro-N-acetylmuramic acid kinase [Limnoglobus roseus]QEL21078.1 Anhydro-N-acetylmuramic acid kinase [Limnoglobus roseus]
MSTRLLLGLALNASLDGIDAALVRVDGLGLAAVPVVERYARTPLLPAVRDALRRGTGASPRAIGEALSAAVRQLVAKNGVDLRSVLLTGLHLPAGGAFDTAAEFVVEITGVTVWSQFAARDVSAGGTGRPFTAAADYLFAKSLTEDRLLIHLGQVASLLFLPAGAKVTDLIAFDAGPGGRVLDEFVRLGTRDRELSDVGGTKAVQGKCLDAVLAEWLAHPHLGRKPPKAIAGEFGPAFVTTAFDAAREQSASLADLLCTATHFIARSVGGGCRQFVPPTGRPRGLYVSGGGVRNGFLWQLLQQQFPGENLRRTDDIGIPALGRNAVAAAVLAGLTLDGVAANLPLLTGASGGRLVGRFLPGDPRNWAAVTAWAAEQMWDYGQINRAA